MNNMRNKILSLLVLLLTAATGARADVAVGDVFMFGTNIEFGSSSVACKHISGSTDVTILHESYVSLVVYCGYENGKHKIILKGLPIREAFFF